MSFGKRLPNILTYFRFFLVPFFVVLMANPTEDRSIYAAIIFIVASFTDWLDGYLARLYRSESILGSLLDPIADKVLVNAALVMLCAKSFDPRIPAWIVVVLLSREIIITGLRSLAAVKGIVVPASRAAKHKTAWTMLGITFLLVGGRHTFVFSDVNFFFCGYVFLWIAMIFSVASGVSYFVYLRRVFDEDGD